MNHDYADIRERIQQEPLWFDEYAVPRYCEFALDQVANIYAREVAFCEIACQACGHVFLVAISADVLEVTLTDRINDGRFEYGDPPNTACCPGGPMMSSKMLRVVEFWRCSGALDWGRVPELEGLIDD